MIAVSSFRPLSECSPTILKNQLRAAESWKSAFEKIIYLNSPCSTMGGSGVSFVESEPFPRIQAMAAICAEQDNWCAIVNADIVVDCKLRQIERKLHEAGAVAAVSRRYTFENERYDLAQVDDFGLDFFAAIPGVWGQIAKGFPPTFRMGHIFWDTLCLGAFGYLCERRTWDITPCRAIFHPKHEDRHRPCVDIDYESVTPYRHRVIWPMQVISKV